MWNSREACRLLAFVGVQQKSSKRKCTKMTLSRGCPRQTSMTDQLKIAGIIFVVTHPFEFSVLTFNVFQVIIRNMEQYQQR